MTKQNSSNMTLDFRGAFIVLDGPDGCGKTTQQKMLSEWIQRQGVEVVCFRDPGTTAIGEQIRNILLDTANTGMGDNVEVLLYMAARAQLWKEYISPALQQGKCVVLDRWLSSTCAYQGSAGGFGVDRVIHVADNALQRVWPDVTIILDVDLQTAAGRMNRPLDRMEQKGREYHQKVREGFLGLCGHYPNIIKIDAAVKPEDVQQQIQHAITACFAGKKK